MGELIKHQHNVETEKSPLAALREGKTVVLSIAVDQHRVKQRTPNPRLVVTPLDTGELCLSLESMGCEIARPEDLKIQWVWKMGLTKVAAEALVSEIRSQYDI